MQSDLEKELKSKMEYAEAYHSRMNSEEFHELLDEIIVIKEKIDLLKFNNL